ncbi:hypothetical protein COY06_04235 [Candidatus Peregrinibacteria bacterium CG_4_10_14_0_2_um_filter_41_8]|nr:MAG: hypothetical protein COY06_04235 [Candidatus Peregrinibacteria bacterium CG_4_10_14_0_2_um_filter_41_8]
MSIFARHKAFSLIEVLISLTVFSIVIVVGINIFISTYKTARQASVENVLLEDARFIMLRLANEIKTNNIDYEEYFSRKVVNDSLAPAVNLYGQNYGLYKWQFFNGGTNPTNSNEDGLGTWCQDQTAAYHIYPNPTCITGPLALSEDTLTGQHPSSQRQIDPNSEVVQTTNSVCVPEGTGYYDFSATLKSSNKCLAVTLAQHYYQSELYLITTDEMTKTIIKTRPAQTVGNFVIGLNRLIKDELGNNNNITEFACAPLFPCKDNNADTLKDPAPLADRGLYNDFVPISPLRTNIKSLAFIISPLEDPTLAFAENFSNTRMHPQVTILLTVEPIPEIQSIFQRKDLALHLQTTVGTRLQ